MLLAGMLAATACARVTNPQGWASPVALDGTLLVSTDKGKLSALNRENLTPIWTFPSEDEADERIDLEALYGEPAVSDDVVYVGAYDGSVHALDLATGRPKWAQPFLADGPVIAGVVVDGGSLYVASDDGNLYVLDRETGEAKGQPFAAGDSIWATPLLADGILYVAAVNGKLFALDSDLRNTWDEPFEAEGGLLSDPVLADGLILVGGIGRRLYAVDAATGREEWSFKADNWFWGRPLVDETTVYAPNLGGRLYALSLQTGEPVWEEPFQSEPKSPIRSGPALAGDVLLVADREGLVYGLSPEDGSLTWSRQLNATILADLFVLDQEVLISAQGGDLFRVDPASGSSRAVEVLPP